MTKVGRCSWNEFDGLEAPASIGRAPDQIHLQSVVHGVRVQLRSAMPGNPIAAVETTAAETRKAILAQVPADAADRLAAK